MSNPGNCISLDGCGGLISSGDFVRYQVPSHNKKLLVGQVFFIEDIGRIPSGERRACVDTRGHSDDRVVLMNLSF